MQMRNSISGRSSKTNIKTKSLVKITCVILTLLFLCLIVGKGLWEQAPGRVYYGVTKEWRYWVDCMLSAAQERDYVYTFAWVDDEKADFIWRFCDDRDSLVEAFTEEKEDMQQKDKDAVLWYFVKLRLNDDIHGTDICEYLGQKWTENRYEFLAGTEDKYEIFVETVDGGSGYCIGQGYRKEEENGLYRYLIRNAVVDNGYLYLLVCDTITEESIRKVTEQIGHFQSVFNFNKNYHGGEHLIDTENLYWIDHTQRVTESKNSACTILEERARNSGWCYADDCLTKYFGMLKEAEYRVKLSPEMPEMTVSFQFMGDVEGDCYETYLSNSDCKHEKYRMEVRIAKDSRLLQEETVWLSICNQDREVWKDWKWETDMIRFEDLDGDGYLDMKMTHPNHVVKYDGTRGQHEDYWLWNQETETLDEVDTVSQAVLLAWQEENSIPSAKEETDTEPQVIPHALTFVVEDGDSLWKLAEKYYGDGKRWREVYEYNQEAIGEDPSLILPGTELEIP